MVPDQEAQSAMTRRAEVEIRRFLEEKGIVTVTEGSPGREVFEKSVHSPNPSSASRYGGTGTST